jgi:hypothetical protein
MIRQGGAHQPPPIRYPIGVFSKLSSLEVPPVCSYANEGFVQLTMIPWVSPIHPSPSLSLRGLTHLSQHELIGAPYSALFTVYRDNDVRYTAVLYNQYSILIPLSHRSLY